MMMSRSSRIYSLRSAARQYRSIADEIIRNESASSHDAHVCLDRADTLDRRAYVLESATMPKAFAMMLLLALATFTAGR